MSSSTRPTKNFALVRRCYTLASAFYDVIALRVVLEEVRPRSLQPNTRLIDDIGRPAVLRFPQ